MIVLMPTASERLDGLMLDGPKLARVLSPSPTEQAYNPTRVRVKRAR